MNLKFNLNINLTQKILILKRSVGLTLRQYSCINIIKLKVHYKKENRYVKLFFAKRSQHLKKNNESV